MKRICPFCNNNKLVIRFNKEKNVYNVCCKECGAMGPDAKSKDEAKNKWNNILKEDGDSSGVSGIAGSGSVAATSLGGSDYSTLNNTPGVGNAVAAQPATNAADFYADNRIGSGDLIVSHGFTKKNKIIKK